VSLSAAAKGEYDLYDLDRFFNYALDLLCIAGVDGYFKRVNPAFERILGYSTEEILSRPFVELIHPDDRDGTVAEVGKLASGKLTLSFENRYRCKDGSYRDLAWTCYPEPSTGLLYAIARDMTEQKTREDRVDLLTGIANRRAFDDTLPDEWNRAARLEIPLGLAVIDVDRFRDYNLQCGHDVGDDFLRQLAKILAEHARRAGDVVARLGGQQFVFLMGGGLSPALTTALAERIRSAVEALRVPHPEAKPNGNVTVSVGTASMVPSRDENHHRLVAAANTALAEAKRLGRNRVVEFSADQS
jgi:diguanylate cyclase (GGDEF)-like protein/PAS domain S-box-containing protein